MIGLTITVLLLTIIFIIWHLDTINDDSDLED